MIIHRSILEPIRKNLTWDQSWKSNDCGLILCWERGRELQQERMDLAEQARLGYLVDLHWKGGLTQKLKVKQKYGTYNYLATLQGIRNEDLSIDTDSEVSIKCSKFETTVIFTFDMNKYQNAS